MKALGIVPTLCFFASLNEMVPSDACDGDSFLFVKGNTNDNSSFVGAAFNTKYCSKPVEVNFTTKSRFDATSAYVAVSPSRLGAGRAPLHPKAISELPAPAIETTPDFATWSAVAFPERDTAIESTFGPMVPSGFTSRV